MKKYFLLILGLLIFSASAFSQKLEGGGKSKMVREVQMFKMKFLAQEMDLKNDQKQKFFKLYTDMNEQKKACYMDYEELNKKLKSTPDATEEDYRQVREAEQEANERAAEIEKEYDKKFSQFLSEKQMYKMKEAEKSFRERMQEMKHKRHPGKQPKEGDTSFKMRKAEKGKMSLINLGDESLFV